MTLNYILRDGWGRKKLEGYIILHSTPRLHFICKSILVRSEFGVEMKTACVVEIAARIVNASEMHERGQLASVCNADINAML